MNAHLQARETAGTYARLLRTRHGKTRVTFNRKKSSRTKNEVTTSTIDLRSLMDTAVIFNVQFPPHKDILFLLL
jgi:hypothetical protein